MHLTTLMTRLPYAVFLSVLLFASHAKKTDNKSTPASNENEEDADLDENALKKWFNKLWLYPTIMIADWMLSNDDLEQVPYKIIKKFDVS